MNHDHLYKFSIPPKQDSTRNLKKIGPGISEEKSLKGVDGQMTDGWTTDRKWSQ